MNTMLYAKELSSSKNMFVNLFNFYARSTVKQKITNGHDTIITQFSLLISKQPESNPRQDNS